MLPPRSYPRNELSLFLRGLSAKVTNLRKTDTPFLAGKQFPTEGLGYIWLIIPTRCLGIYMVVLGDMYIICICILQWIRTVYGFVTHRLNENHAAWNNELYNISRQSQVQQPNGSKVKWAGCSLIIGVGCRVQVFLALSSIAQSVC